MAGYSEELSSLIWSILTVFVLLYVTVCIYVGIVKYKSTGLWLRLLIGIEITLLAEITRFIARHHFFVILTSGEFSQKQRQVETCNRIFFSMYSFS